MKKIIFILILLFFSLCVFSEEIYRIRIENSQEGLVQVSLDEGKNYFCVGRVKHPANKCGVGFMASGYIEGGAVCAVASHAIRIKVSPLSKYNEDFKSVRIFSVLPKEFWTVPKGFGGHIAYNSGIYTDIHCAQGIFLNFAPFPETKVYEEINGKLQSLSENHIPNEGNIYVIPVEKPKEKTDHIDFENYSKGKVVIDDNLTLTNVIKPVSAIGRYDATTYNSPGQINTAHGGVITVATSKLFPYNQKEGDKPETRGGFMIQPGHHALRQNELKPQVMTVGKSADSYEQEGKAPLYSKYINLWYYPNNLESSYYAELKIDDKYIKMPAITGRVDNGLTKEYLNKVLKLNCKAGVTGVRLHIPEFNKEIAKEYLIKISSEYNNLGIKKYSNNDLYFVPQTSLSGINCSYYVDGVWKGITSQLNKVKIRKNEYVPGLHHFGIVGEKNGEKLIFSEYFLVN